MSDGWGELHEVRILEFPLDVYQRTSEAFEGLKREFTLIALRAPGADEVPSRLLELVDALTGKFAGLSDQPNRVRDEALARGDRVLPELRYRMPEAAIGACVSLNDMLDEADQFCRRGDYLLSLESPAESVAFRRWYLGEIVAQLRGAPPVPWSEADVEALLANPRLRGI